MIQFDFNWFLDLYSLGIIYHDDSPYKVAELAWIECYNRNKNNNILPFEGNLSKQALNEWFDIFISKNGMFVDHAYVAVSAWKHVDTLIPKLTNNTRQKYMYQFHHHYPNDLYDPYENIQIVPDNR